MALRPATVLQILGEVDDATLEQILSFRPSEAELREAVGWLEGDENMEAQLGEPTSPTVVRIVALLQAVEGEEPDEPVFS